MARQARESGIPSRELFENNPLPMWVFDLETLAFLAVNSAAVRHYGFSRREFLAMTIKEIRPPEEIPALLEKMSQPNAGYDEAGTWRHRQKDGTIIDVEISTHTIRFGGRKARLVLANDVTERKRLEQGLHAAAEEWRTTFDAMSDAVALIDRDGTIFRCNKAMTILAGKGYDEIVGHRCWEVVHGTSERIPICFVKEMLTTRQRTTATVRSGARAYKIVADPLFDTSGRLIGAVHIMSVITQQEQAEKILHDLALQQEAILNNIPDIAWLKDDQGRFLVANAPFGRACGVAPADLIGQTDFDIWPRQLAERYRADDAEVMRSHTHKIVEEPLADKEGKTAWIETIKTPIIDEQGRVVGTTGIARDITARKQAETALQASEKKFRTLFETANDAIFILDRHGRFIDVNTAGHERLGYTRAELLAKSVTELDSPEFAARVPERTAQIRKYGRAVFESAHLRKDGTVMPVEINAVVIDHEGRKVLYSIVRDMSARKAAEAAIAASEERYRNLFDNANDMIQSVAPDGRFLFVNPAWRRILGYSEADLCSLTVFDIIHPSCKASGEDHFAKVMSGEPLDFLAAKFVARDGRVVDVEGSANVRLIDGKAVSSQGIFRDVTERKKLGEDLYRISHDWEETFDTLTDMVTVHDKDFNIIRANKAAEKILGLPFLEARNAKCFDYFHGTACPPAGCPSCASLVTGRPSVNEIFEPHLGRHLEIRAIPRLDSNNQVVGLIHVVRDISERKKSEEEIKRYDRDLAALNTASNTLMLITSLDGIYQEICNIVFSLFELELVWFGVVEEKDCGVRPVAHAGRDDGYLGAIQVRWDDSPLGMGPTGMAVKTKTTFKEKSSDPSFAPWREAAEKRGYVAVMAVPLIQRDGQCGGVLTFYSGDPDYFTPEKERLCRIFANQSAIAVENALLIAGLEEKVFARTFELEFANVELQHLNKELELRRLEAESASRTKSDFLANMSHELRTPLNAIIGFSDIMVRGMAGPLPSKPKEYLGDILASGKHLLSLINDILDLSKVEAGKMEIEPVEYDLAELVNRSLVLFREKTAKHRLRLEAEIADAVGPVFGDERKIRQVLYNLLSNAVKFTPDGGTVIVRAKTVRGAGRDCAEISVFDTGIGISAADQKRLFQPFGQLSHHLTKEHEGTGLGLTLCKSFVEMHGGLIRVESAPGRGSTFTFRIPLRYEKGVK
ncbi:MAG: PAS domain-containing sensor histidine kinase [Candidatus Methylomirabilia bacterium]